MEVYRKNNKYYRANAYNTDGNYGYDDNDINALAKTSAQRILSTSNISVTGINLLNTPSLKQIDDGHVLTANFVESSMAESVSYDDAVWEVDTHGEVCVLTYSSKTKRYSTNTSPYKSDDFTTGYGIDPLITLSTNKGASVEVTLTKDIDYEDLLYTIEADLQDNLDSKYANRKSYPVITISSNVKVKWKSEPSIYGIWWYALWVNRSSFTGVI